MARSRWPTSTWTTAIAWSLGLLGVVSLLLLPQLARVFGRGRGTVLGLCLVAVLAGSWWLLVHPLTDHFKATEESRRRERVVALPRT